MAGNSNLAKNITKALKVMAEIVRLTRYHSFIRATMKNMKYEKVNKLTFRSKNGGFGQFRTMSTKLIFRS